MKSDEVDQLIEEALAESHGGKHRKATSSTTNKAKARQILNIIFMLGALATLVIYFACPDQKILFFSVGFGSVLVKVAEFFIRFLG